MTVKVCEPVLKNGKWELVEHTEEREYPNPDGRHDILCVACGFPTYPACRAWCGNEQMKSKKS